METTFDTGAVIDMLTPAELADAVAPLTEALDGLKPPSKVITTAAFTTDGTGAFVAQPLFRVPTGYRADILRVVVSSAGATPAAPVTTGQISFARNDVSSPVEIWFPQAAGGWIAPASYEGGETAPALRQGETLVAWGSGLTATRTFLVILTLKLWGDVEATKLDSPK